jgi:Tannase and feruloyl esterase
VFDPRNCNVLGILDSLIGTVTPCGTFTKTDALVVQAIWQGPRLSGSQKDLLHGLPVWFGMEPGANLAGAYLPFLGPGGGLGLATTFQASPPDGPWAGAPFIPSADWFQNWIKQDPNWVFTEETYQQYWQDFLKSGRMFDSEISADNPNLHAFKAAGGKLIMWQGLADQLIFTGDSINYYNRAVAANGGLNNTESFFRYFLAPGVAHRSTPGPGSIAPTNPMQQVINWVEHGQAPAVLDASGTINGQPVTRPLCSTPTRTRSTPAATQRWLPATPAAAARSSRTRSCCTASTAGHDEEGQPVAGPPPTAPPGSGPCHDPPWHGPCPAHDRVPVQHAIGDPEA